MHEQHSGLGICNVFLYCIYTYMLAPHPQDPYFYMLISPKTYTFHPVHRFLNRSVWNGADTPAFQAT